MTWMNLEKITLAEKSQSQKATYDSTDKKCPEEGNPGRHKVVVVRGWGSGK